MILAAGIITENVVLIQTEYKYFRFFFPPELPEQKQKLSLSRCWDESRHQAGNPAVTFCTCPFSNLKENQSCDLNPDYSGRTSGLMWLIEWTSKYKAGPAKTLETKGSPPSGNGLDGRGSFSFTYTLLGFLRFKTVCINRKGCERHLLKGRWLQRKPYSDLDMLEAPTMNSSWPGLALAFLDVLLHCTWASLGLFQKIQKMYCLQFCKDEHSVARFFVYLRSEF